MEEPSLTPTFPFESLHPALPKTWRQTGFNPIGRGRELEVRYVRAHSPPAQQAILSLPRDRFGFVPLSSFLASPAISPLTEEDLSFQKSCLTYKTVSLPVAAFTRVVDYGSISGGGLRTNGHSPSSSDTLSDFSSSTEDPTDSPK